MRCRISGSFGELEIPLFIMLIYLLYIQKYFVNVASAYFWSLPNTLVDVPRVFYSTSNWARNRIKLVRSFNFDKEDANKIKLENFRK